uniref:Uncharacterized protein n=1 Tax=Parascaris equorum TaxID=6256 RepID=A0A914S3J8_PAREQ
MTAKEVDCLLRKCAARQDHLCGMDFAKHLLKLRVVHP